MAPGELLSICADVIASQKLLQPESTHGWNTLTWNAQERICSAVHMRRFRFPAVAANLEVLAVTRKDGEWTWEVIRRNLDHGSEHAVEESRSHFLVLDTCFFNVARVYVPIPGNPEPFMIGTSPV
jgi:hypothetical protein